MKIKKKQRTEIIEILPQKIQLELNLILQSKSQRGILKRLPFLFSLLSNIRIYSSCINQFQDELDERNQRNKNLIDESIMWFKEKLELLKSSQWAEHSTVKYKIQRFEDALNLKCYNPLMSLIDYILQQFKHAAFAVAAFGQDHIFDKWAQVNVYAFDSFQINSFVFLPDKDSQEEKWRFADDINKGYASYKLSICKEYIELAQGHVDEFFYPNYIEELLTFNSLQDNWASDCESDATTLFTFLKILSQYPLYKEGKLKPLKLPLESLPKTIEEADEIYVNGQIVFYLSCFDARDYQLHPLSLKELKEKIITFLTMLVLCTNEKSILESDQRKRKARDEARVRDAKKAKEWMKNEWKDPEISHSSMAAKLQLAIGQAKIILEGSYKPSSGNYKGTFEKWASQIDPWPLDIRIHRKKAKNLPALDNQSFK